MAQPPVPVTRTFDPVGQLQLHSLGKLARFHCIRCQQDKMADLLATTAGDWTQTVCYRCYERLLPGWQEKVKKVKPAQPGGKPSAISEKKLRQLRRKLPGIDGLLAFFSAAGVRIEFTRDQSLRISGKQIPPIRHLPPPGTSGWNDVVDEIAFSYAGGEFMRMVDDNAHMGDGLRAFPRRREQSFAIMRGDVRLATISPTRTRIPHREDICANFLIAGPHWQQVADAIRDAEPELVAEWERRQEAAAAEAAAAAERRRAATPRRIDHLPEYLSPELIDVCLKASRRIRLERQVAYERPVVLECRIGELTLWPVAGPKLGCSCPSASPEGRRR
jgi:hypothetical protein